MSSRRCQDRGFAENHQEHCLMHMRTPLPLHAKPILHNSSPRAVRSLLVGREVKAPAELAHTRTLDSLRKGLVDGTWTTISAGISTPKPSASVHQTKRCGQSIAGRRPAAELWTMASHGSTRPTSVDLPPSHGKRAHMPSGPHASSSSSNKTTNNTVATSTVSSPSSFF